MKLYVCRFDTRERVHEVEVEHPFATVRGMPKYEVVMAGMLRQMDTDTYYIDDSEIPTE